MIGPRCPKEVHVLFQDAFNRCDPEAIASLYEPGAILVLGGERIIGREDIKNAFCSLVGAEVRMSLTTRMTMELPEGLALLHGEWTIYRGAITTPQSSSHGISAEVIRMQEDGTWRFIIDNPQTPEFSHNPRLLP